MAKRIWKWIKISLFVLSYVLVGGTGILIGTALSQGAGALDPARSLFATTAALDRSLTAALAGPRRTAAELVALRAEIDRVERTVPRGRDAQANLRLAADLHRLEGGLRRQNEAYEAALLAVRELARRQHEALEGTITRHGGPLARILTGTHAFLVWIGPALVFAFIVLVLFVVALMNPRVRQVFMGSGSVTFAGITWSFKDIGRTRSSVEDRVKELDGDISKFYRSHLTESEIEDAFGALKGEIDDLFKEELSIDLHRIKHRANLFVPGFAGDELIQATPYYGERVSVSRVGIGRRFSARYGMVGKCWRLGQPLYNDNVSNKDNALIRDWGLMPKEARAQGKSSKSLMGLPLLARTDQELLGVIFLEAPKSALRPSDVSKTQLFGSNPPQSLPDDEFAKRIWNEMLKLPAVTKLVEKLQILRNELAWDEKVVSEPGR